MKLDLKTLLKATLGCVILTLGWYFLIRPLPVRIDYFREIELIGVWSILGIAWIAYLIQWLRKNKKNT